jgi:outer membrane protein insertion porin family
MSGVLAKTAYTTLCMAILLFCWVRPAMAADAPIAPAPSAKKIIVSIDVAGNRAVETGAILERMHTRVGDALDRKLISRDVRKLFATGFFKDIKVLGMVKPDGLHLTVLVVENPVIASLDYEGLHEVKEKDLKMRMKLKAGQIFNEPELHEDITTIRKGYLKKGYYQVDVQPIEKMRKDGRMDLTIKITEGEVTRIKRIRFIGNKAFDDTDLADAIASRPSGLVGWFKDRDVFDRNRLEADRQLLMQHYMNNGFLDVKVESTLLALSPDKHRFYVTFSIHEGPQYHVSSIKLSGDMVPDRATLEKLLQLKDGDLYSLEKLRNSIDDITTRVGDEGYAFATVTPLFQRHPDQKMVDISLDIEKGREVYVERIEISGNQKTEDSVVRREMRQMEGSRFSSSNLETSKKRINRLGYFEDDVRVSMPKGSAPDKVDLKLNVNEKSTGSWSFGVGYSQLEKVFFRSSIRQNNFLGKGYATNLTGDIGAKVQNFTAGITDPYFLGEDVSASLNVFKTQSNLQAVNQYKENNYGVGLGFGIPITDNLTYGVNYQFSNTNISGVPAGSSAVLLSEVGHHTTSELSNSLTWDTRDSLTNPTSGSMVSGSIGAAGLGGQNRFLTSSAEAHTYYGFGDGFVLNPGAQVLYIRGYSGSTVPIYRRFSLGGIGTVRGFDTSGITIRDPVTNDILGGNKAAMANLNLFFPLPYMRTSGLRGLVFADAGDVADFGQTLSFANTRVATGLGIEWLSPIGPIGLSWGFVLRDRPGDLRKKFEFAIGTTF